jgi:hypothetical protein
MGRTLQLTLQHSPTESSNEVAVSSDIVLDHQQTRIHKISKVEPCKSVHRPETLGLSVVVNCALSAPILSTRITHQMVDSSALQATSGSATTV